MERLMIGGDRWYRQGSLVVPSVTTVLSRVLRQPGLERWRGRVGNQEADRILQEAQDHGSSLHAAVAGEPSAPAEYRPFAAGVWEWLDQQGLQVIMQEQTVLSRQYRYAGTLDILAARGQDIYLIDIKTSRLGSRPPGPRDTWRLQTAAYALACPESLGITPTHRLILHLPSDTPGVYVYTLDRYQEDVQAWLWAVGLYWWRWETEMLDELSGGWT